MPPDGGSILLISLITKHSFCKGSRVLVLGAGNTQSAIFHHVGSILDDVMYSIIARLTFLYNYNGPVLSKDISKNSAGVGIRNFIARTRHIWSKARHRGRAFFPEDHKKIKRALHFLCLHLNDAMLLVSMEQYQDPLDPATFCIIVSKPVRSRD